MIPSSLLLSRPARTICQTLILSAAIIGLAVSLIGYAEAAGPPGIQLSAAYATASETEAQPCAAWVWDLVAWRTHSAPILDKAQERGIDTLFIPLTVKNGVLSYQTDVARFVRLAHQRGILVFAVEGDPHMVLPAGLQAAVARANAIRAYQEGAPRSERLDGLQYDLEPYGLKNFDPRDPKDLAKWLAAYKALRAAFHHRIEVTMPFWIADDPDGEAFVREAAPLLSRISVMAYRNRPNAIIDVASRLLALGSELDVPVRVALEIGPTDEGSTVSFEGNMRKLRHAMEVTTPTFLHSPSFVGFAIDGLRWPGQKP